MGDTTFQEVRRILSARIPKIVDAPSLIPAGVLLLIYPKEGEYHIHFNVRTGRVEHHKGEISFPGGRMDSGDASPLATALRETYEEVGVRPDDVEVLGTLDQDFTRSGFLVTPFVGTIPDSYTFRPQQREVAEILEVPVAHLLDSANTTPREQQVGDQWVLYRDYHYQGHLIFGLTARILTRFLDLTGHTLAPGGGGTQSVC